ncbi:hypothetical protein BBJ28_00002503 [Nothophytophthora sp. Chile5]|nr:hypothetical protein BBJ28_00002503 [Nothophytophthora sp. Chile5]
MTSLYATIAPQFTRGLLSPGLEVGYTDGGGVWQFLAPSLAQRLPLRAIEWRNLMGVTKRIDQLPLHFVEASASAPAELPLACIYLAKCEDLESYKTGVRAPLVAWVDAMTAAKAEWLVLYVPLGTRAKAAGNAPNAVYKKVFDRLRADFSHRKNAGGGSGSGLALQERVCKIDTLEGASVLGQQQQHESQWTELLLRLRHCVMDAFQIKCFQYEEQLRLLDAQRNAPGWDFGAFFLAKERLALMYQQMYLQDDAIRHVRLYLCAARLDELDAIFVNLNDTEKQFFRDSSKRSFAAEDPIFTQSPLALDLRDTQREIAANGASAQRISLHCFCRQIRTLYLMGSFPQLLQRASAFIETFLAELQAMTAEGALEQHQSYLWAVGACLEVAYACELSWSGRDDQWTSASVAVEAAQAIPVEEMSRALGDVVYLARRILKGFARANSSSSNAIRSTASEAGGSRLSSVEASAVETSSSWYEQLQRVFVASEWRRAGTCEPYERCVSEVSHLASMHFSQSGRHRFAVFLGGECARYHLARGEFESASRLLRSLARQSEEDGWWTIFGECVRRICHAELALGRSVQAVAACFSMLQLAQEEQAGVGKEEMEQLMRALVASLEGDQVGGGGREPKEEGDDGSGKAKMNLGELFRPSVAVETTQTSGNVLDHGEIRVTLGITNDFPAGVHLETLRVRFKKEPPSPHADGVSSPQQRGPQKEATHLDDLVLDADAKPAVVIEDDSGHNTVEHLEPSEQPHAVSCESSVGRNSASATGVATPFTPREGASKEEEEAAVVLLEESNVYLDEKTGVNLVFLHSGVPVGRYTCTSVECVITGNAFRLLPPSALALAGFEIAARESTVQVAIDGARLLMSGSSPKRETITVSVAAHDDVVANGILELRVFRRVLRGGEGDFLEGDDDDDEPQNGYGSGGEEDCGIQLLSARQRGVSASASTEDIDLMTEQDNQSGVRDLEGPNRGENMLSVALPTLPRGGTLVYDISLLVPPIEPLGDDSDLGDRDDASVTVCALVRYQRDRADTPSSAVTTTTEIRRTEVQFRVLQPLAEKIRLKRAGQQLFASIALTCNAHMAVVLRDYRLLCSSQLTDAPGTEASLLTVAQDPNARLRGTALRPRDRVHLAFTLVCSPDFDQKANDCSCLLQLDLSFAGDEDGATWQKTMVVPVVLAGVEGQQYRIDVVPKGHEDELATSAEAIEVAGTEPVTFQIRVQERVAQVNSAEAEDELVLCLDESSERDWILVGKQLERFALSSTSESNGEHRRVFATQKRFFATRAGRLRFPAFRLEINGQTAPAARVLCQQSCRRVFVS